MTEKITQDDILKALQIIMNLNSKSKYVFIVNPDDKERFTKNLEANIHIVGDVSVEPGQAIIFKDDMACRFELEENK